MCEGKKGEPKRGDRKRDEKMWSLKYEAGNMKESMTEKDRKQESNVFASISSPCHPDYISATC